MITDLGIMGFDSETKQMRIESVHSGVTSETVRNATGFEVDISQEVQTTVPPTSEELRILREVVDPTGFLARRKF